MKSRNTEYYSGTVFVLIWIALVTLSLTFWAGLSCLIGRIFQ